MKVNKVTDIQISQIIMIESDDILNKDASQNMDDQQRNKQEEQESNQLNKSMEAFQIGGECCRNQQIKLRACITIRDRFLQACKRQCSNVFLVNQNAKAIKLSAYRLFNFTYKSIIKAAFHQIKKITPSTTTLNAQNSQSTQLSVKRQLLTLDGDKNKAQEIIGFIQRDIQNIRKNTTHNKSDRKIIQLEMINSNLKKQLNMMQQQIEFFKQRQERQNQKKKQSLLMLAQELGEKNQVIQDLKKSLKFFEDKYQTSQNILDDDLVASKKQVQNLQLVRKKLQDDLQKYKQKLENSQQLLKQSLQKIKDLLSNQDNLQHAKIQYKFRMQKLDKVKLAYDELVQKLTRQNKRLNIQIHKIEHSQNKQTNIEVAKDCINNVKLSLVLKFVSHISEGYDLQLSTFSILNQQQLQILSKHKIQWIQLQRQAKGVHKIDHIKESDFSGILIKGANGHLDTLFNVLDSPKNQINHHNGKGTTMRILQLQLEKNQQVEKISELKNKIMHIRIIILNLLKALQIQQNTKAEALAVLQLVFELFQYSQQERQSIFVKKKKIFGLI